jgi:hypothetical protein
LQQRTRLLGNEQDSTWIFSKNEKQRHKPRRAHTNRDAPTQTKRNGSDFPHLPELNSEGGTVLVFFLRLIFTPRY